jgi:hypothetical protein
MNKSDTLIVMGNGPSLADVDFNMLDGYDTFGLNSAYRAYRRLDWWPTYHGCFDYRVTDSHREEFIKLIEEDKIKRCFYINKISDNSRATHVNLLPFGSTNRCNNKEEDFQNFHDNGNSGANSCSVGICLGYKKIILLGVDCNYVEFVDGCAKDGPGLKMDKTPDQNPNYWFDDYQQVGDEYNVPRGRDFHKPTWNLFSYRAVHEGIDIVNCSPVTTLRCFRRSTLEKEIL